MAAQDHWEDVYREKGSEDVSWFQPDPAVSERLVGSVPGSVVDVGAGASTLVDGLLDAGRTDVTVLDLSAEALAVTRARLGDRAGAVTFVATDVLDWDPGRTFDVWHDRAVFHFLTEPDQRERYLRTATRAVAAGGVLVMGTFATDGPTHCSGLPTVRYDARGIAVQFAESFRLEHGETETHRTPWGAEQPFTWVRLRRLADPQ